MERRYRPRKEFKFWLYHDLPEQGRLMEYIEYLRKTRQFATIVRNGLRLMWSLSEGDLSVLFELFPTLRLKLTEPTPPTPSGDFQKMLTEAARQGAQLALLEAPALPAPPAGYPTMKPATGALALTAVSSAGIKPLTAPSIAMPTFEDDDQDTVVIRRDESAGEQSTANFLQAALGIQAVGKVAAASTVSRSA